MVTPEYHWLSYSKSYCDKQSHTHGLLWIAKNCRLVEISWVTASLESLSSFGHINGSSCDSIDNPFDANIVNQKKKKNFPSFKIFFLIACIFNGMKSITHTRYLQSRSVQSTNCMIQTNVVHNQNHHFLQRGNHWLTPIKILSISKIAVKFDSVHHGPCLLPSDS